MYSDFAGDLSSACSGNNKNCYEKSNELLENSINDNSILFFVNNSGKLNILAVAYYDGVQDGDINHYLIEV